MGFKEGVLGIPEHILLLLCNHKIKHASNTWGLGVWGYVFCRVFFFEAVRSEVFGAQGVGCTWTPKVCRIIAFYRFWAIVLPTFGGLGSTPKKSRSKALKPKAPKAKAPCVPLCKPCRLLSCSTLLQALESESSTSSA